MGKYRSRIEIVAEILRTVSGGARKTHIMYQCNLSFKLLMRYLRDVIQAELICEGGEGNNYVITEKGKKFLRKFEEYVERSERVSHEVDAVNNEKSILETMTSGERRLDSL